MKRLSPFTTQRGVKRKRMGWRMYSTICKPIKTALRRIKELSLLRIRLDDAICQCRVIISQTILYRKFSTTFEADRQYWFFYSMLSYNNFSGIRFYGVKRPSRRTSLITSPHRNRLHPYGDNRTMVYRFGHAQEIFTDVCISYMDFRKYIKELKRSVEGYA